MRAARHEVRVVVEAPENAYEVVPVGAFTVLVHALLDHAISASPAGSQVLVTVLDEPGGIVRRLRRRRSALPGDGEERLLSREFEAIAQGRPTGVSLMAAHTIAAHMRAPLDIEDGPTAVPG